MLNKNNNIDKFLKVSYFCQKTTLNECLKSLLCLVYKKYFFPQKKYIKDIF